MVFLLLAEVPASTYGIAFCRQDASYAAIMIGA
jgi:hypothetical protein